MADYLFAVGSNSFNIKEESIDNMRRALLIYDESYVSDKGEAFIGSYDMNVSDTINVVIDKRTNRVIGSYETDYLSLEDCIEENGDTIEEDLQELSIPSEEEYNVEDFTEVPLTEFIQENLLEGEHVFIKEAGNEKLRYIGACGLLITKTLIKWLNLDFIASEYLSKEGLKP